MLELREVRVALSGRGTVLDGVSLTADDGQVTALVGPGGRGYSTLLNAIARRLPFGSQHSGQILLNGVDLLQADPGDVASRVLLVRPDDADPRTVGEALQELGADPHDYGLDERRDRTIASLPADLRARVALARLKLEPPRPVVLADQLMAAADPLLRRDIGEALRARAADGAHVLWAEHQLDAVWEFADAIVEPGHPTMPAGSWKPSTVREPTLLTLARIFRLPQDRCRTSADVRRLVGSPALTKPVPSSKRTARTPEVTVDASEIALTGRALDLLSGECVGIVHREGRAEPIARRLASRLRATRVPSVLPDHLTPAEVAHDWDARHRTRTAAELRTVPGIRPSTPLSEHSSSELAALRLLLARSTARAVWLPQPQLGLDQAGQIAAQRELFGTTPGIRIVTTRDIEFLVRACNRIAVIEGDEIVAFGSPAAVQHQLPTPPLTAQALVHSAPTRLSEIIESVAAGGAA